MKKTGLKLNIQRTKITASSPTTSWQTDRETMEIVAGFIFMGSKITAAMKLKDAAWKNKPKQESYALQSLIYTLSSFIHCFCSKHLFFACSVLVAILEFGDPAVKI